MNISSGGVVARLAVTAVLIVAILLAGAAVRAVLGAPLRGVRSSRVRFWATHAVHLGTLAALIVVVVIVWSAAGVNLTGLAGWTAAGLTIALQRVVTAFAGYLIILRGSIFRVGDRITIGGVRGDVIALGFMQTTVMEMGQAPGEQRDDPSMWIRGRQYSGRIVRVTNDKVFDTPIYNFTKEFPFVWEEIVLPVRYADDYLAVERILLDVARRHTEHIVADATIATPKLMQKYELPGDLRLEPRVFLRLTDNWIELSVRFLGRDRDVRALKDAMAREILDGLRRVKIGVASATYAIVEVPPLAIEARSESAPNAPSERNEAAS